ncbi:MAG TPA: hypothetical protein VK028_07465 [Micromonosporaceae bacterium]|nr:hypothetical protein [Micromonosporaceae bacterium]
MPEQLDLPGSALSERMRATPGLAALVAEAVATWRARALADGADPASLDALPAWRAFEDSFPTFYEFTNRR